VAEAIPRSPSPCAGRSPARSRAYLIGASGSDAARGQWLEDGAATHLLAAGTFVAIVPLGGAVSPPVFVAVVAAARAVLLLLTPWLSERRPGRLREATA
jgi:hypothetical protein